MTRRSTRTSGDTYAFDTQGYLRLLITFIILIITLMTATTKTTTKPTADKIDFKKIFADKKAKFDQCFKEYKKLKDL